METKFISILFIILITTNYSKAQVSNDENNYDKIGIFFSSFGENDMIRFQNLDGAASYLGESFYTIGINYIKPKNNWLEFETGIEYSKHNIIVHPNLPPDMDNTPYNADFYLLNIPISIRANFLKYFFVNSGLILDLELGNSNPADNQTGIGGLFGIAAKYDFEFGASIFINPYLKAHSLIPFAFDNHHQRLMENGVRFGISYNLKNLHR